MGVGGERWVDEYVVKNDTAVYISTKAMGTTL